MSQRDRKKKFMTSSLRTPEVPHRILALADSLVQITHLSDEETQGELIYLDREHREEVVEAYLYLLKENELSVYNLARLFCRFRSPDVW